MTIRINIDEARYGELTGGALCLLNEIFSGSDKEPDMQEMHELIAPFMQDENGEYLDEAKAHSVLRRIKQKNFAEQVFKPFVEAYRDHLVPKANGNNSALLSTTEEQPPTGSPS